MKAPSLLRGLLSFSSMTMVSRVLDCPALKTTDVSSLRSIPMGGATVPPELRATLFEGASARAGGSGTGLTYARSIARKRAECVWPFLRERRCVLSRGRSVKFR